jgi:hypothetical protein
MNASELLSNFRALGPQPLNVVLQYLADHFHEFRTRTGHKLFTGEDTQMFLEESADVATKVCPLDELVEVSQRLELQATPKALPPAPQPRYDSTCPRCGHKHTGDGECGMFMGMSAGYCKCDVEVVA